MTKKKGIKTNQIDGSQDMTIILEKIQELIFAIGQYKAENPDVDVDAILSEQSGLLPMLGLLSNRELDKFISYAKEQGTRMPFQAMEMGVLAAGRKDMQNGLAEILDSMAFDKPGCNECNEEMDDRGRSKKKS